MRVSIQTKRRSLFFVTGEDAALHDTLHAAYQKVADSEGDEYEAEEESNVVINQLSGDLSVAPTGYDENYYFEEEEESRFGFGFNAESP